MSSVNFTPQQKSAIYSPSGNLLISAAAGSGKTAVLTQRVIDKLTCENSIGADKLIVVTFTVASSIEMRQRIEKKMNELILNDPENQFLQSQALLLSSAKISTIHSLCNELVKENFQALGLPVNYRLAQENEIKILKAQILDEVIDNYYASKDDEFLKLADFFTVKDDSKLLEIILNIYDFIRPFPFPIKFLWGFLPPYQTHGNFLDSNWGKIITPYLKSNLLNAKNLMQSIYADVYSCDEISSKYADAYENDFDTLKLLIKAFDDNDWDKCHKIMSTYSKKRFGSVRNFSDKDLLEKIKEIRGNACDILKDLNEKYFSISNQDFNNDLTILEPILTKLFEVVETFYNALQEQKIQNSILDFSDLEQYTLELLIKQQDDEYIKTPLAIAISEQYEEIMIDECQDVNTVQHLIFWGLSKSSSKIKCDFDDILIDSKNLFLVGDVKQSIYRFRNAMPQLFTRKATLSPTLDDDIYKKGDTAKIILQQNFRSNHYITDFVNFIFSNIMSPQLGEVDYNQDEYLIPAKPTIENDSFKTELHLLNVDEKSLINSDGTVSSSMQAEANYIAKLILNMVNNGYSINDNGVLRKCKFSDFCILLRSKKTKATKYIQALKELDINCFSDTSNGYFNSSEIAVMLDLLRIIDNPLQDIPLFSVLISPMFMFTPDEISTIRIIDKSVPLYVALTMSANINQNKKCQDFLTKLDFLRQQSLIISTHKLIQKIYDETGFLYIVSSMNSGEEKQANLQLLLTYAQNYESIGYKGVSGFIGFIDKAIERDEDFSSANILPQQIDAVKIMSIHGSKGLEFPICIVADIAKNSNLQDLNKAFLLNSSHGFGTKIYMHKELKFYSTLQLNAIRYATKNELLSEEMRTLYVALTRPKEKLILVGTLKNPSEKINDIKEHISTSTQKLPYSLMEYSSYLEWILCAFAHANKNAVNYDAFTKIKVIDYLAVNNQANDQDIEEADVDAKLLETLKERCNFKYDYEELSTIPAKITVTQIAKAKQEVSEATLSPLSLTDSEIITGAKRGTVLHSFMQYADFKNAQNNLENEITRLVENNFISDNEQKLLNRFKIKAFLKSSLLNRMLNANEIYREYQFIYKLPAHEVYPQLNEKFKDETVVLQGIADTVFVEDDGVVIVDYKTDRITDENEFIDKYKTQLLIYKNALSSHFDVGVKECYIYSLHLEKAIKIDV